MNEWEEMAHDAGYRGEHLKLMARAIEEEEMRKAFEREKEDIEWEDSSESTSAQTDM